MEFFKACNRRPVSTGCSEEEPGQSKMQTADQYKGKIMQVLAGRDIPCICEDRQKYVYAYLEVDYGEVYSIYECDGGPKLCCCSVYSLHIPESRREKILEYLLSVNSELDCGGFYIDRSTGHVAFGIDYQVSAGDAGEEPAIFESFCLRAFILFGQHGKALFTLANEGN